MAMEDRAISSDDQVRRTGNNRIASKGEPEVALILVINPMEKSLGVDPNKSSRMPPTPS
jgi:hypothetical protein